MFVINVHTGRELQTAALLRKKGFDIIVPRKINRFRKSGTDHEIAEVLFSSYIFLVANEFDAADYYKIVNTSGVLSYISQNPLPKNEEKYIKLLRKDLDICQGIILNEKLVITSGRLLELEHKIISFNKRQRTVTVELTVYGEFARFKCSVDMV